MPASIPTWIGTIAKASEKGMGEAAIPAALRAAVQTIA